MKDSPTFLTVTLGLAIIVALLNVIAWGIWGLTEAWNQIF